MGNVSLRCLFKPDVNKLSDMYQYLGRDYDERVLQSIINEVLKSVVAQYNASALITQREKVSQVIRQRLTERAKDSTFCSMTSPSLTLISAPSTRRRLRPSRCHNS